MKGVIHWVSAVHNHPAEFRLYDRLFTVPNPGAAEEIESVLNPTSLVVKHGFVEQSLANAEPEKVTNLNAKVISVRITKTAAQST